METVSNCIRVPQPPMALIDRDSLYSHTGLVYPYAILHLQNW